MNIGNEIEELVERLITNSFFSDFTVRSPKYRKSGQEKEASDFIVLFEDTLIGFQVKSKQIDFRNGNASDIERKRVERKMSKAVAQFRALSDALSRDDFDRFVNGRGHTMLFDKKKISQLHLIVIGAILPKDRNEGNIRLEIDQQFDSPKEVFHYFDIHDFKCLMQLIDTLPDFLYYLDMRSHFITSGLLDSRVNPLDFWAFMTFEQSRALLAIEDNTQLNLKGCLDTHSSDIEDLEKKEKPSYLIDRFVQSLFEGIGSDIATKSAINNDKVGVSIAPPGSIQAYQKIIPYLARLSRNERIELAEQILLRVERCKNEDISFGGVQFNMDNIVYAFMASKNLSDNQRQAALLNLCCALGYKYGAEFVVGLSIGFSSSASISHECLFVDVRHMNYDDKLIAWADEHLNRRVKRE